MSIILKNSKILLISVPHTYVDVKLCPFHHIPIWSLKFITYLKNFNNKVEYINMLSESSYYWKNKPAGRKGNVYLPVKVSGKPFSYLVTKLREIDFVPDFIILEIYSTWVFYSFDIDLAEEYISIIKKIFPNSKIILGGDSVRYIPRYYKSNYDVLDFSMYENSFSFIPSFSVVNNWDYGLFQLESGCHNKCSFCESESMKVLRDNPSNVIKYMEDFYNRYKTNIFWCWDPNVLIFKNMFLEFIDLFKNSKLNNCYLAFGKGFQVNLIDEQLVKEISLIKLKSTTIPIENATSDIYEFNKPYNIISSIKALNLFKEYGFNMKDFIVTFLLGYPEDDFKSIFRSFLTGISLETSVAPFPVFLFPNTTDMKKYYRIVKHKKLEEIHGQLFPLIDDSMVDRYNNLLNFLRRTETLKDIPKNISVLDPQLRDIMNRELDIIPEFIKLCITAKNDSIEELSKIEKEVSMKKISSFKKLLYITANPKELKKSVSKQLGEIFIKELLKFNPKVNLQRIDLYNEKLKFINEEFIDYIYHRKEIDEIKEETKKMIQKAEKYVRDIETSDIILMSLPMWSWSIPSILKCYLEYISSFMIFYYRRKYKPKKVFCILTREGTYPYDTEQEGVIKTIFLETGISKNINFIKIDSVDPIDNYKNIDLKSLILQIKKVIKEELS
jgi:FMN-dependent NADH-azoreductase